MTDLSPLTAAFIVTVLVMAIVVAIATATAIVQLIRGLGPEDDIW